MPKTILVDIHMVVMLLQKRPLAAILEDVLTNVPQEHKQYNKSAHGTFLVKRVIELSFDIGTEMMKAKV
jgi:hypothetical protein